MSFCAEKVGHVFKNTVLEKYIETGDNVGAAAAFKNEIYEALRIHPIDGSGFRMRTEFIRTFIIKILIFLEVIPRTNSYGLIARIIEYAAMRPDLDFTEILNQIATAHSCSLNAVQHIISNAFSLYDPETLKRIKYLTHTNPLTPIDMIYDISQYVRAKYVFGDIGHE